MADDHPIDHPLAALPPGHFLALPPTFSNDPTTSLSTTSHAAPGLAPNVASLAAADFDVDVRTGFLPGSANVERLPAPFDVWEDALDAAAGTRVGDGLRLNGGRDKEMSWRAAVASLPTLDIAGLNDLPLLRRAHIVLAFLAHFYVHCAPAATPTSPHTVPASISVPLLAASRLVGLPPILTYADTVLWNVLPEDPDRPTNLANNPPERTLATFTNTRSEAMFYLVSAECEAAGAAALALMRQCLDELFLADELALRRLTVYLRQLAVLIDRVGDITLRMNTEVDPEEFYHLIRPWFRGGDADGPSSPGWLFLGTDDEAHEAENTFAPASAGRKFSGPSAGQSSLVHAFDIFLTVDHSEREDEAEAARSADPDAAPIRLNAVPVLPEHVAEAEAEAKAGGAVEATFLQRMLQYMPLPHRTFLLHLSSHPTPLRPLVLARKDTHPALANAYDGALAALRRFRDKHMRVVSRFIVQQARRQPSARVRALLGQEDEPEDEQVEVQVDGLRGTGGTPLIRFLKRCRDNTSRAMVSGA
ncbi:hypothetical protein VHUM_02271 [Vanrija humicola]|uniref:Indoleamine 2,3-dioxygenase n=1 Tax=Vanrija humicola TaxID=5417 RepID=A0A7D8V1Y8_VANHU|nr:hypothetical protein VHUM_02271 [Vanrija humicola]